jgi:hypothetical protein
MCGRYTLTIDRSTIEKRFGGRCRADVGLLAGELEARLTRTGAD